MGGEVKDLFGKNTKVTYEKSSYESSHEHYRCASIFSARDVIDRDYKIFNCPDFAFKIRATSNNFDKLEVQKMLDKSDLPSLPEEDVIHFANIFLSADTGKYRYLWFDEKFNPVVYEVGSEGYCVDFLTAYDDAPEVTLSTLAEITYKKSDEIKNTLLLMEDGRLYKLDENRLGKLFGMYLEDWFEIAFPGLMVSKESKDSKQISSVGYRLLLQLFADSIPAFIDTSVESYPASNLFYVSLPQLKESKLTPNMEFLDQAKIGKVTRMFPKKSEKKEVESKKENISATKYREQLDNINSDDKYTTVYPNDIIHDFENLNEPIKHHANVTWLVFKLAKEFFPVGCDIYFAPNEVILDQYNNIIFSADDVERITYHGEEYKIEERRNSVGLMTKQDYFDPATLIKIDKYFKKLGIKRYDLIAKAKK